jgi:hypothetical protein
MAFEGIRTVATGQRRYLAIFALGVLAWAALCIAFILIVDPYGVSPVAGSWHRFNEYKPKRLDIDRSLKPYEVLRYQPRTVFLGTSRIHQSIDPAVLDGTRYAPAYNASIPASSLQMNVSHLRTYIRLDKRLRAVVVELFLYNFVGNRTEEPPLGLGDRLRDAASLFVSADALQAAVYTVTYNAWRGVPAHEVKAGGYFYYPPGHDMKGPFDSFAREIWKLHETRAGMKFYEPAFEAVRELVRLCREHDLELVFFLTPNHAYDDYYIDSIGAWGVVEEWLRRVTAEGEVYSFSQPNAWVYESVSRGMRYWNDPYHFTLAFGRAMELLWTGRRAGDAPDDLMMRMTPALAAGHVEHRRRAIRLWALQNPDFVTTFGREKRNWEAERAPWQAKATR